MTFDELVQEVYNLTNRPDLDTQTKSAIKAATLKAHLTDFYSKDIYETGIEFGTYDYIQSIDFYNIIPNMRAIKYVKLVNDAKDQNGVLLDIITPEEILDSYNRNKANVAYIAGRVLNIRAAVKYKYALFGCYVLPVTTEDNYSSWIAVMQPYAIIYSAAVTLFKLIGYDEEASAYATFVAEEYRLLKINHLTDVGY